MSLHPSAEALALYLTSDLPLFERVKIRRHLTNCEFCDHQFSLLRASQVELKRQAAGESLTGFEAIADWSTLEREMRGNIAVGLAAARCIEKAGTGSRRYVKFGLAASFSLLFVIGWMTHVPALQSKRIYRAVASVFQGNQLNTITGPILRSQPGGIVVGSPAGSLTIFHPAGAVVSAAGRSSVEARYIDDETGQVTITQVYGQ